ncbi:MAG: hypothetical protein PHT60_13660 [Acidiphilium sp.]|nr:hypothetical protein [Acidiphilium sp.]MDD4936810.1 hypothetical protein [Acidiphilium sp.]
MIRAGLVCCLLAGCAGAKPLTVTKIKLVQPRIPAALLTCPASPAVPVAAKQSQVAVYIVDLWRAHAICYEHLAAVRQTLLPPRSTH